MTQSMPGSSPEDGTGTICCFRLVLTTIPAVHNYGNLAPESAMHGIVLRFAQNCWVHNVRTPMTGPHPTRTATEDAKNIQVSARLVQVVRRLTFVHPDSGQLL